MKMLHANRLVLISASLVVLALTPSALAGQPVTQTLIPPPPTFEICKAIGTGTICQGAATLSYGPVDTGIVCGIGASAFDIFDAGTFDRHAARYYDQNGRLTRRVKHDQYSSANFSNPLTGATVPYAQSNTTTDVLAVPGDLSTATETDVGENNFTVPHLGAIFLNAGRTVTSPDGSNEFEAGPQGFLAYFIDGDASVLEPLCAALGAA
jgi:hypothetical protein